MNDYFILKHKGSGLCIQHQICNQKDNWCSKECQLMCPHTREQCLVNNIKDNINGKFVYNNLPTIKKEVPIIIEKPVYKPVYMLPEEDENKNKIMILCVTLILFIVYRRTI